jgi:hypothetical protein
MVAGQPAGRTDPLYELDPIYNIMVILNGGWPASQMDRFTDMAGWRLDGLSDMD